MVDRKLTKEEVQKLKSEKLGDKETLSFTKIFEFERTEPGGREDKEWPTLYEMVLLEMLAKIETQKEIMIRIGRDVERLKSQQAGILNL